MVSIIFTNDNGHDDDDNYYDNGDDVMTMTKMMIMVMRMVMMRMTTINMMIMITGTIMMMTIMMIMIMVMTRMMVMMCNHHDCNNWGHGEGGKYGNAKDWGGDNNNISTTTLTTDIRGADDDQLYLFHDKFPNMNVRSPPRLSWSSRTTSLHFQPQRAAFQLNWK